MSLTTKDKIDIIITKTKALSSFATCSYDFSDLQTREEISNYMWVIYDLIEELEGLWKEYAYGGGDSAKQVKGKGE